MLKVDFEAEEDGTTVPYGPLFDDIRKNYGFIDLRGRPDLAQTIPEGMQSAALWALLVDLSQPTSSLFSLGCDLGSHEEPFGLDVSYVAGGYIQIVTAQYLRTSADEYLEYAYHISDSLEAGSESHDWQVRFVLKFVSLKLDENDEIVPSVWIWFYARAQTLEGATKSREVLVAKLRGALQELTI